jgi:hypothetical protein
MQHDRISPNPKEKTYEKQNAADRKTAQSKKPARSGTSGIRELIAL